MIRNRWLYLTGEHYKSYMAHNLLFLMSQLAS